MKIKCAVTDGEWWVNYIVATNPRTHECRQFYGGYEIIPDEPAIPKQSPHVEDLIASNTRAIGHNTSSIERLTSLYNGVVSRIRTLESDNKRLRERLNAVERQTRGEP